ncbi:MAG: hypothetical protein U9O85_09985 [Euryarchaeota archaeon]|nr:hypothetical protein [Euryarchaeota archaeon]
MKKWKTGAIIGAVYYLLGLLSVGYIYDLDVGIIVFLPTFFSGRVIYALINAIFPNSILITLMAMLLSTMLWALIGAGVGHLVEIFMNWL